MDVRCPVSRHLLFRVADEVDLGTEIEIKCECKRLIVIRDPRNPLPTEARTLLRSEPNSREELAHGPTNQRSGPH